MKTIAHIKLALISLLILPLHIFSQTILINENFTSGLPAGWTNIDNAGTGDVWEFNDPGGRSITAGNFSGNYAIVDSDNYGSSSNQDATLTTSSFDASSFASITLAYDYQYREYDGPESCNVQVYNGSSWTTVTTYVLGDENWSGATLETFDITAAAGASASARVRFTFVGEYDWWWALDNIKITGTAPVVVASPTGPGGIGSGDGSTELNLWLQADQGITFGSGTSVSTWADQSGNGNNVSQGSSSKRPNQTTGSVNSYPTISFDGSNDQLNTATFGSVVTKSAHTSFFVWKYNGGYPVKYESLFASTNSSSSTTMQFSSSGGTASDEFQFANTSIASHSSFSSYNISTLERTSANQLNGWVNESSSATNSIGTTAATEFYLYKFGVNRNGNKYLNSELAESIIFHSAVTDVQRIIINNYLSAKYGISLSANDYFTQDSPGNGNFDYNVAGIGRAADGSLHDNSQGTGIIKINNPSALSTDEFLFWGEDIKNATYGFTTNSTSYTERQNSTWRVSKRNDLGTVTLSVAASDLDLSGKQSCASLNLIVSSSSTFGSKTTYPLSLSAGVYTANNVSFTNGDYFTFEYIDLIVVDNTQFYNGAGTGGAPDKTDQCYKLLVKNTATGAFNITESATVREIEIESGGQISVASGIDLNVVNSIRNNGTFTLNENSSLIQNHTGANSNSGSGTYVVKRSGNNSAYVYNIWSSPISSANVVSTFIDANPCDIWVFDRTSQAWNHDFTAGFSTSCNGNAVTFTASDVISGGDGIMDVCGGYFIPGIASTLRTYSGEVNNGTYSKLISTTTLGNPGGSDWADDDWNLLGNPYPSALSASAFWNENAVNNSRITDALYFWDEADTTGGYNQNSDYASWNLLGGVNSGNSVKIPSGNIASGQGFWVVANANTSVIFNNSMRASANSQFFKVAPKFKQHNAWISFTSPSSYQNNVLVGYNENTTDSFDIGYDAHKLVGNAHVRFASYLGTDEFVIQGLAPITSGSSKVIPLVVTSDEYGDHIFKEYQRENLPSNFKIYLRDNFLGIDHDLSQGDYVVTLNPNIEYKVRFELVFKNTITNTGGGSGTKGGTGNGGHDSTVTSVNENINSDFLLIQNQDELVISNQNGLQGNILIYDISGKLLWTKEGIENSTSQTISWNSFTTGAYFITVNNGDQRLFMKQVVKP